MNKKYVWYKIDGTLLNDIEAKKHITNLNLKINNLNQLVKDKLDNILKYLENNKNNTDLYESIFDNIELITNVQCDLEILIDYIEKELREYE